MIHGSIAHVDPRAFLATLTADETLAPSLVHVREIPARSPVVSPFPSWIPSLVQDRMDRGGTEDSIYEGIRELRFEYWDSAKKEWDDEWDTRRTERKSILPTRVKITLTALDEAKKEVKYTTQARIMLNTEFPRFQ